MIDYMLIRSRRKTIALHITKDATVEVRAPLKVYKADIDRFVASKEKWISSHLKTVERNLENKSTFTLTYSDMVILCGKEYPIRAKDGIRAGFDGECFYIPPDLPNERIKEIVIQIYKLNAKRLLKSKVDEYGKTMGVSPAAVKVNSAKTRWGSCSGGNSVNFSWRLVMADEM